MKNRPILWSLSTALIFTLTPAVFSEVRTQPVPYHHGDVQLEGFLAYDDAQHGPRPGVLVIHEWWGLNDYSKSRVRQLAQLGYVAFALDMYGSGKATTDPKEAQACSGHFQGNTQLLRDRAKAGLDVLAKHELVDPARLAAIGYCFGGTTAMELAYSGVDLRGIVSFHGAPSDPKPEDAPHVKAKLLICHGADDPMIPSERMEAFKQALQRCNLDWQIIFYSRTRHSFTNPGADRFGIEGIAYSPDADRRSWEHMKSFFSEIFSLPAGGVDPASSGLRIVGLVGPGLPGHGL